MAWVRLDDKVMTHPRIYNLSDKSFRLWIWGLCYSQQHLTDGAIPAGMIPPRLKRSATDLVSRELWTESGGQGTAPVAGWGFSIRDFLQWNDSKAEVERKRQETRDRVSGHRARNALHATPCNANVPVGCGDTPDLPEKKRDDPAMRAGRLLQELYPAWYSKFRHGAKLRLLGNSLEFQDALSLVKLWDDSRLEQLAQIILTTDEPFIASTDRGFKIFTLKASWADSRLRELEAAS